VNWANRLNPANWGGVLTFDSATNLPKTIAGGAGAATCYLYSTGSNYIDIYGYPLTEGRWRLTYGDASTGVNSSTHKLTAQLIGGDAWTEHIISAGTWSVADNCCHDIITEYTWVYGGTTGSIIRLDLTSTAAGGDVTFPDKGNGQVELSITPPSVADRNVAVAANYDPIAPDAEYLLKHQQFRPGAIRWMPCSAQFDVTGGSYGVYVADLDSRKVDDFTWATQLPFPAPRINVIKVEPVTSFDAIIPYLGVTTQAMTLANWDDFGSRVIYKCTTDVDHLLRTDNVAGLTNPMTAPNPVVDTGLTLTGNIASATGTTAVNIGRDLSSNITTTSGTTVVTVNSTSGLTGFIRIDSEELGILAILDGRDLSCSRGINGTTGATHTAGAIVYPAATTISVSATSGLGNFLGIDSEQLGILSILGPTSLLVSRGVNGTTGATHTSGANVYVGISVEPGAVPMIATGARTFVVHELNFAVGANTTIKATVNYTPPNCPNFIYQFPPNNYSVPYEFQAKTTNSVALANGIETILWTNIALLATDDYITEVVQNRIAPYLTSPHVTLIVELANELWNPGFHGYYTVSELYRTSPNPETSSTGFASYQDFIASRQHHINGVAKAAFTAAGLDSARVYNFYPGRGQNSFTQPHTNAIISYCQVNSFPIDYIETAWYVGFPSWDVAWGWMPVADGGSASWGKANNTADRAWARRVMMSYMRAWTWFSPTIGVGFAGTAQAMSWYKAGKSVAGSGVGSATANTGLGKICAYEGGTELDAPQGASTFVFPIAMEHDLVYDGIPQWSGDTGWHSTETAFFAAVQGAAALYASLMPVASFPDLPSAIPGVVCYFSLVYVGTPAGGVIALYDIYDWQGQQPGTGAANTMGWDAATPAFKAYVNQSVRAQTIIDWNAATSPALTGNASILLAGM
jgi:hypothetical protein